MLDAVTAACPVGVITTFPVVPDCKVLLNVDVKVIVLPIGSKESLRDVETNVGKTNTLALNV